MSEDYKKDEGYIINQEKDETSKEKMRQDTLRDLEALLLLSKSDLKIKELTKFFSMPRKEILNLFEEIKLKFSDSGINIEINGDSISLITNPKCGETIHSFYNQTSKPKKLSAAAMETLSIIAYKHPITRAEIESIRGVSADGVVQSLEYKKLIKVCGKKDSVGRPNLYTVTDEFLAYMGLESIEELPNYKEMREYNGYE